MPIVAGIDPASGKLDFVITNDDEILTFSWRSSGKWSPQNTMDAHDWITTTLGHLDPGIAWIEDPVVGVNPHSTIVQAYTSGAAQAALLHLGWDVRIVNVSTWKKQIIGSGSATKHDIGQFVEHHWPAAWGHVEGNADLIDASAICLYGLDVERRARHLVDGASCL